MKALLLHLLIKEKFHVNPCIKEEVLGLQTSLRRIRAEIFQSSQAHSNLNFSKKGKI